MDVKKELEKAITAAQLDGGDTHTQELLESIQGIVKAFETIRDINVDDVEPLYMPTETCFKNTPLREDVVKEHITPEEATKQAPDTQKNLFLIPQ